MNQVRCRRVACSSYVDTAEGTHPPQRSASLRSFKCLPGSAAEPTFRQFLAAEIRRCAVLCGCTGGVLRL